MARPVLSRVLPRCLLVLLLVCRGDAGAQQETPPQRAKQATTTVVPDPVKTVLNGHCVACHGEKKQQGKVRLDTLDSLDGGALVDLLNRVQEQVHFRDMPPAGARQVAPDAHKVLMDWIREELKRAGGTDLVDKLRYPDYGNAVDHAKLFGGAITDRAFTPARRWLVSPQIFHERVLDVFKLTGRDRDAYAHRNFYGIANPFLLPEHSGVRYYDMNTLDGGHLLVMQANADWISTKQIHAARIKKGEVKADVFPDPRDRWYPKSTPAAFEAVILKATPPTDTELSDAIHAQFDCVLQRRATDAEVRKYLALTRSAIQLAGNTEGLRQLLVAVLLDSEFLYRLEFGAGEADEHGRKKLSPREAAYAISYSLGDRNPDLALIQAAREGRLVTKEDYRREVLRLLADEQYYRGQIDPTVNGQSMQSHATPHPKLVRFFREFFGYPGALRVFKDLKRGDGIYHNPDRGSTQTPGHLIDEADRVVARIVLSDRGVFETLLTTDQFFVYHNLDNEKGSKLVAGWEKAYKALKDTNWRADPDQVVKDHADLIQQTLDPRGISGKSKTRHDNSLVRYMNHFEQTFGRGNRPFTTLPWAHGNHFWHSPIYSLPGTPGREGKYGKDEKFDYHPVQPFAVPNRKGILTHPAWLVAHSGNFQTDPIRRGRWIREKLLAGRVPDVPITVDAKVPDDPHKSFRQRVEAVTQNSECAKCHRHMNPLGFPFESFDDFGRYRTVESLEHPDNLIKRTEGNAADIYRTVPVVTTGRLDGTGDPQLDGDVKDAFDLIDRLARSERVRQSIIRHAFRFFLGRNEMLSDAQTLIDADRAYVTSGGSFKAVVVSLLTSDSFLYRKP